MNCNLNSIMPLLLILFLIGSLGGSNNSCDFFGGHSGNNCQCC